jgi:hypothetical protein
MDHAVRNLKETTIDNNINAHKNYNNNVHKNWERKFPHSTNSCVCDVYFTTTPKKLGAKL